MQSFLNWKVPQFWNNVILHFLFNIRIVDTIPNFPTCDVSCMFCPILLDKAVIWTTSPDLLSLEDEGLGGLTSLLASAKIPPAQIC